ncbi:arabinosylfuranosidase ArfA [Demequina lutea]|uniref:non-reducing end alpha-L-arabinofuranosidase n=1 Tax=Demequina lutea TaxID=431489 RepID=A0A7Z0CL22_9MICO|nr:alpha-N-arabinofuranosidase [Demequina lutea]NYI42478.1 alpha-N-arabinofuranosidase [Demequina lutea]
MLDARLTVHPSLQLGPIDRRLFGGFVEHLGRHIYDGIYEPAHPTAGADGFRRDVIDLVKELGVTCVRYPGGNFVSGLRWEDTVGPVESRPRRLDLAWHSTEPNTVGLHEFSAWLEQVGADLMLAVNLGTRGVQEALDLLEYANIPGGTELSDRRSKNGRGKPFDVRMWCLGNEMDGPWQLGHKNATDYGTLAAATARAMRQLDPAIQLVASGSSGRAMPTFGAWERGVLEESYDVVDYVSCHAYYAEKDGDAASFLASGVDMDRYIEDVISILDEVKTDKHSSKTVNISFDEWNVWYQDQYNDVRRVEIGDWPVAARLLEDRYNVTDAVVVGGLLISLLNHADRVTSASLAQLVNVIAPIMTEPGGPAWRQTTFHPFAQTAAVAHGHAMRVEIEASTLPTSAFGDVASVDAAASYDGERVAVFVVNRHLEDASRLTIDLSAFELNGNVMASGIWDDDRLAANTLEAPDRVKLRENSSVRWNGSTVTVDLPPVSWTVITVTRTGTEAGA